MLFPSICVDNFFNDPRNVIKIADSCEYNKEKTVPGTRSLPLHQTHYDFYNYFNVKILSILYPNDVKDIIYKSLSMFQRIPSSMKYDGWVHKDEDRILTSIIYLSNSTAGTSIYKPKNPFFTPDGLDGEKHEYFLNYQNYKGDDLQRIKEKRNKWNNYYEETVSFKGQFNRMICFDAHEYHAAHIHEGEEDRLTLITFFDEIKLNGKKINYAIPTIKRI
jgi:hypothetical protein